MKNYYCVVCKYLGCENAGKGDIALQEFNRKFFVRLPAAEFTVIHGECGLEFTYSPCDVYRKDSWRRCKSFRRTRTLQDWPSW